jgi:hypothetical protein
VDLTPSIVFLRAEKSPKCKNKKTSAKGLFKVKLAITEKHSPQSKYYKAMDCQLCNRWPKSIVACDECEDYHIREQPLSIFLTTSIATIAIAITTQ